MEDRYEPLRAKVIEHLAAQSPLYAVDAFAGADPAHRIAVRVVTASPYHALSRRPCSSSRPPPSPSRSPRTWSSCTPPRWRPTRSGLRQLGHHRLAVDAASIALDAPALDTNTMLYCVLVLPYALVRWGSGREVVTGLTIIAVPATPLCASPSTGPAPAWRSAGSAS